MGYRFDNDRNNFDDGYSYYDNRSYFSSDDKTYINRRNARRAAERQKQRKKRLFARRATIVGFILLFLILVIVGFVALCNLIFGGSDTDAEKQGEAPTSVAGQSDSSKVQKTDATTFVQPKVPDDNKTEGHLSASNAAVYIYNNAAYELFAGSDASAKYYAQCISDFKASLGDSVKVYNMVVPKPVEFGVPKRLIDSGEVNTTSQSENIKRIYTSYTEDVIPINCYNELANHLDEYIYFRTDHHWTGLGAYYAYKAFCEQTGQKVLDLDVCQEHTIDGYQGTLTDLDPVLYENLDTVHYWTFPYNTYATITESTGATPYDTSIYYEGATGGSLTYGVFIWGDHPVFVEHNEDIQEDKKIAVIKESYGNAMVPYLTANYKEVHVIDFRHFEGNLKDYCTQNGITEVLFVNNIMAANTAMMVDQISTLN